MVERKGRRNEGGIDHLKKHEQACPCDVPALLYIVTMDNNHREDWERFLKPEVLRANLMLASIYIAAYEILKDSIVKPIKDFYATGFNENGYITGPNYASEVPSKGKNDFYASLEWLKESSAITDDDITLFNQAKKCRNKIAHEISRMLAEGLPTDFSDCFNNIVSLISKIGRWWAVNVEIPLNPEFVDKEVAEEEIIPGQIARLRIMMDVALGSEKEANFYFNELMKSFPKTDSPS